MGKNTRPLSGNGQRTFFRALFQSDEGVSAETAVRLTDACTAEIASIRVRLPMIVRKPRKSAALGPVVAGPAPAPSGGQSTAEFDPHAFSLIVTMRKGGADALTAQLAHVADVARMHAIAKAQHVSVDPALSERAAVIAAIVEGTERRIAHRQAAAS